MVPPRIDATSGFALKDAIPPQILRRDGPVGHQGRELLHKVADAENPGSSHVIKEVRKLLIGENLACAQ